MSEINEHLSNSTESRGKKSVINYPNLSESVRLKRKRKMETETTSPKKRRRTENEVSETSFDLNDEKTSGNTVETFIQTWRILSIQFLYGE